MRIAIFGAGAIGTWMGAALAESGQDVTLVARGAHLEALRAGGATLRSAEGERTVPVPAVAPGETAGIGPVDVVVLSVKAHDLAGAAADVQPLLGPDTTLVAAQNGIPWWYFHGAGGPHEGRIVEAVDPGGAVTTALSPARTLGTVVYVGASIAAPGVVATRPEAGLVLGEPDGSLTSRLATVADAFDAAGFPVRRTRTIRTELWTKLMGNASFNLVSVLTRAGLGTMSGDPATAPVVEQLMREIVALAAAHGARPEITVEERIAISRRLGDHKTSTLQDLEAGKRLELDALGAAVVELAEQAGADAPVLRTVYGLADLQARTLGLR